MAAFLPAWRAVVLAAGVAVAHGAWAAGPSLIHRWSFNGDYADSVGGADFTGTDNSSSVTFINDNTAIRLAGGTKGTSWVELNPNKSSAILPAGNKPFTIEVWTTIRAIDNYSAIMTLGKKDNTGAKSLMCAFYNPDPQIKTWDNNGPVFHLLGSSEDGKNILMGRKPLTAGGTYHLAIVVKPHGDGNGATVEGYVHDVATGARFGGNIRSVTGWTTSLLVRESFALGRNFWNDPDPQADYDEVRVWDGALSMAQIEANIASGPDTVPTLAAATIDDSFFRYDFTGGTRVFTGNGGNDPAASGARDTAVEGPNGLGSAVHPIGYGSISDGAAKLNADWTLAMSVKSCDVEQGVMICLGSNTPKKTKQFIVASSSSSGKLYVPIFQNYGSGKNVPTRIELNGLGDTTNEFHSLVAVHVQSTPTDVLKGGTVTLYWDGKPAGSINTAVQSPEILYSDGFQFSSAHGGFGGNLKSYIDLSSYDNLAFQDVRFFDRALSSEEAELYAKAFPPFSPGDLAANEQLLHRWSFNGSLSDTGSVGGKDATLMGTEKDNMSYINDNTEISLTDGGGVNRSWIQLGDNIIPASLGDTPFTIELWTTLRERVTWSPIFGLGIDQGDDKQYGLHVAYHGSSGKPIVRPIRAAASGGWEGDGNRDIATEAFPVNEKCHVAIAVTPDGNGNATIDARIHRADGTLFGSARYSVGSWSLAKITQGAFNLGRSAWGDANPKSSYDEVRVWKTALTAEQIEANIALGPDVLPDTLAGCKLGNFYFRYGFENGTKQYVNGMYCSSEPTASASGSMPADGPGGPGTAAHPYGYGSIPLGDTYLNADWTLAMSVRSVPVDNGILLTLGGDNRATDGRELRILSSATPGKLRAVVVQTYSYGGNAHAYQNAPAKLDLTGLGDVTNTFHSLVAEHSISDHVIRFYLDGAPIGKFNSSQNMSTLFRSWIQFCQSKNDVLTQETHSDTVMNPAVAFRDVRLYRRRLEPGEIMQYAEAYPAAEGAYVPKNIDGYAFRHDFTSGKLVYDGSGYTDNGLAGTGEKVMGAKGARCAAFPDTNGWCAVEGGLNRDWTCAMSVKMPAGIEGNGIMLSLGGQGGSEKRALVISSVNDSSGSFYVKNAQRYGSGQNSVNTTPEKFLPTGLGDVTNMFHSLVVVHAKGMSNASNWRTGTFGFYWDGAYIGSMQISDGVTHRELENIISYGCIKPYNPHLYNTNGNVIYNPPFEEIGEKSSGFAVQEMRFSAEVWSEVEARAYAERFPAAVQRKPSGFSVIVR